MSTWGDLLKLARAAKKTVQSDRPVCGPDGRPAKCGYCGGLLYANRESLTWECRSCPR